MLPLSETFFQLPFTLVCLFGIFVNIGTIVYGRRFILQVILFMCRVEKIKAFNQIISLIKIPD
jgi:hypothetical protein